MNGEGRSKGRRRRSRRRKRRRKRGKRSKGKRRIAQDFKFKNSDKSFRGQNFH